MYICVGPTGPPTVLPVRGKSGTMLLAGINKDYKGNHILSTKPLCSVPKAYILCLVK